MAVNIFGRHSNAKESAKKIAQSFGHDAVWIFKPTKAGNSIIVALRAPPRAFDKHQLAQQANAVEAHWALPTKNWLKSLKPL